MSNTKQEFSYYGVIRNFGLDILLLLILGYLAWNAHYASASAFGVLWLVARAIGRDISDWAEDRRREIERDTRQLLTDSIHKNDNRQVL